MTWMNFCTCRGNSWSCSRPGGVGHDVIKILNFSAIQCKFNRCLNNCTYRQQCCNIILLFQIRWGSSLILGILKSYWILYYKNIVFPICVDSLRSSALVLPFHLQPNWKFHTRTCTLGWFSKKWSFDILTGHPLILFS